MNSQNVLIILIITLLLILLACSCEVQEAIIFAGTIVFALVVYFFYKIWSHCQSKDDTYYVLLFLYFYSLFTTIVDVYDHKVARWPGQQRLLPL